MDIIEINETLADNAAPLAADFRVTLRSFKGIESQPDIVSAKEEILDFLKSGYPVFAAEENGELAGYIGLQDR